MSCCQNVSHICRIIALCSIYSTHFDPFERISLSYLFQNQTYTCYSWICICFSSSYWGWNKPIWSTCGSTTRKNGTNWDICGTCGTACSANPSIKCNSLHYGHLCTVFYQTYGQFVQLYYVICHKSSGNDTKSRGILYSSQNISTVV